MAKITSYSGEIPKRIGNLVFYKLRGQLIVRTNSGFTTEANKEDAKYAKSRNAAREFGKISSLCKKIRVALADMLPKKNNLAVINSLNKIMIGVLTHDVTSPHGERNLATALSTETARQLLIGYDFNPDAFPMDSRLRGQDKLTIDCNTITFPAAANCVGFRTHLLAFDFTTTEHQLESSDWHFYNKSSLPNAVEITLPIIEQPEGVVFTILEMGYYKGNKEGCEAVKEEEKSVKIVEVC